MASSTEIKHDGNLTSANTMRTRSTTGEFFACYAEVTEGKRDTLEKTVDMCDVDDDEEEDYPFDGVFPLEAFPRSRHRDGSMYKNTHPWIRDYRVTDRCESKLSINASFSSSLLGAAFSHTSVHASQKLDRRSVEHFHYWDIL
jgi:hypothetical protein